MNKPKIALGWIRPDMVDGAFQDSVSRFLDYDSRNHRLTISQGFTKALYLDDKRNAVTRDFLKSPADYLMWLDTDIEFEPQQIYQLVQEAVNCDRAIIAGCYFAFLHPGDAYPMPVWFSHVDDNDYVRTYNNLNPAELVVPIVACGMGFTLIRRDVFEKFLTIPEYASNDWTWYGRDTFKWKGESHHHGEDICFCVRAYKLGFQAWGHHGVVVRHWKKIPIDLHLFNAMLEYSKKLGVG